MRLSIRFVPVLLCFVGLSAPLLHAQGSVSDEGYEPPCRQTEDGCPKDKYILTDHYDNDTSKADRELAARDAGFTEDQVAALNDSTVEALARGGNVLAQVETAGRYLQKYEADSSGTYSRQYLGFASSWYMAAAKQGSAVAENDLATMMVEGEYNGGNGPPPGAAQAVPYFQSAVDQGYAPAFIGLADLYSAGNGVAQDFAEALRLINLAIQLATTKNDHATAAKAYERLSRAYAKGLGVAKSPAKAAQYKQKSVAEKAKITSAATKPSSNPVAASH